MRKIQKMEVITLRQIVESERQRLKNLPNEPNFKEWLHGRKYPLGWMKDRFGETLKEKDGFIMADGITRDDSADCSICGKESKPDQNIIRLTFSFCGEYSCGMNICINCIKKMEKNIIKADKKINKK